MTAFDTAVGAFLIIMALLIGDRLILALAYHHPRPVAHARVWPAPPPL